MKKKKILSVLAAVLMTAFLLCGCSRSAKEEISLAKAQNVAEFTLQRQLQKKPCAQMNCLCWKMKAWCRRRQELTACRCRSTRMQIGNTAMPRKIRLWCCIHL